MASITYRHPGPRTRSQSGWPRTHWHQPLSQTELFGAILACAHARPMVASMPTASAPDLPSLPAGASSRRHSPVVDQLLERWLETAVTSRRRLAQGLMNPLEKNTTTMPVACISVSYILNFASLESYVTACNIQFERFKAGCTYFAQRRNMVWYRNETVLNRAPRSSGRRTFWRFQLFNQPTHLVCVSWYCRSYDCFFLYVLYSYIP